MRNFFRARTDSTADAPDATQTAEPAETQAAEPAETQAAEPAETQAAEPVAVVTPVETTTASGETKIEWATLGALVPVPQAVPAAARHIAVPSGLSDVSAASVARILGVSQPSTEASDDAAKGS